MLNPAQLVVLAVLVPMLLVILVTLAVGVPEEMSADVGDYVLATKWPDGDPCDHFYVGWVAGFTHHGRYKIVDENGERRRGNGFRRAEPITKEEGRKLIERFSQISDCPGAAKSLWWHLDDIRGEHEGA